MSKKDLEKVNTETSAETKEKAEKPKKNLKKLKYGSAFFTVIALVTAIVVVINLMAGVVSKRYPIKIDLTADKRYELSDETISVLQNLDKDIDITVAMEKSLFENMSAYYESMYRQYGINAEVPYNMIPVLLEKYSMYAEQGKGSVSVRYVNIDKDPDVLTKYSKYYNGSIENGAIVVYADERVEVIPSDDVLGMIKADQASMQSGSPSFVFAGESTLTSAIMNVTDAHPVKAAVVKTMNGETIYGESDAHYVETLENSLLTKNGYSCTDVDIKTDDISPEEYDLIVIASPTTDFTEDIIEKLDAFLYNGGKYDRNLIYIPQINSTELNNINAFLADWNIEIENNFIMDDQYAVSQITNIMLCIDDADTVGAVPNAALPIIAPYSREVKILDKNNDNVVKSVLRSYDNSFIGDMLTGETGTERGAHSVAVLSSREHAEQFNTYKSNVLVIGSSFMTSSEIITQTSAYNNANVLIGIFNNMTGKESGTVIPEKALQQSYIAPTQQQAKIISIVLEWVIPALVAVIGLFVLLRRRNR